MKLPKMRKNANGWSFNEGGHYLTACSLRFHGGGGRFYRLWLQGLEVMASKIDGKWPRVSVRYRRVPWRAA